ncbi:MAG: hypothetical protein PHT57_06840 [Rhodoferax sp.]|nr:hypothetical protein [Rhodoferax sp.]
MDNIDGGAGTDTLNVADSATTTGTAFSFGATTIKNVENIVVATNGKFDALNVSKIAGLTSFAGTSADTAAATVTAADTTNVVLNTATTAASTVTGGKVVSVTKGAAAVGTLGVTGKALTDITIKGGAGAVTIDNQDAAATSNKGITLKTVTLDGVDAGTGIGGEGLESVTVKGATTAARTVTITNAKADHALTVNVDGTGYKADGTTAVQTVVADAAAKTITVNATGAKSSLALTGSSAAKALNITGSAALDLAAVATATKIDGSAATGNLTLNTLNAVTVDIKTGSGNDKFTATTTSKIALDAGAGNDTVTLSGALVLGSNVNLGAGNDKLIGDTAVLKAGAGIADSVVNGGDGTDTVSAALITAGNAALFTNFEGLSLNSSTGLDANLLTGSTLTALSIDSTSTTALYQNLSVAQVLDVSYVGDNSGVTNTLAFKNATGTADTFAIKFTADNSAAVTAPTAANVKAGGISAAGIESFTIESAGTKAWNSLILTNDAAAKTVAITGASNLDLTFVAGANGFGSLTAPNTGVSLIDGSAATGKLAINVGGVTAATAGLTVKGGLAADTLTTSTFATTLSGGAGADTFTVAASVVGTATPAGAVITSITDAASADKIVFADKGTEVFTTTKVDVSTATALIGGTTNALDLALAGDGSTNGAIKWFQYGGNTYVVEDLTAGATVAITDVVVKLTGLIDLSTASYDATTNALTLA